MANLIDNAVRHNVAEGMVEVTTGSMNGPPVLIFDEPFNGMDPEGIIWMKGFLRSLAAQGRGPGVQPPERRVPGGGDAMSFWSLVHAE